MKKTNSIRRGEAERSEQGVSRTGFGGRAPKIVCKPTAPRGVGTPMKTTNMLGLRFLGLMCLTALVGACHPQVAETPADPGVIDLVAELGHEQVLAEAGGEVLVRLRVRAGQVNRGVRAPLNLALVIDTSGSMEGEAIETAREASKNILGMLRDGDRISVISFHSFAETVFESTLVDDADLAELGQKIDAMQARGTTDLAGGMQLGLQQVAGHMNPDGINRVVLLGDGVPNDPSRVIPLAQQYGTANIPIAAIGLGLENDEILMGQIAQLSNGHFEYVEEPARVAEVFRDELLRMDQVVARGAGLTLQPGPGVEILEVLGQETPAGGGGLSLALGDLSEGQSRELVVRLSAPGRRAGALVELLDANLVFVDNVVEAGQLRRSAFLGARANADAQVVEASRNASVHETAQALQAAAATLQAIQMVRTGQVQAATALLEQHQYDFEDGSYAAQAEAQDTFRRSIRSSPGEAPSAPPASVERSLRRAHSESMDALGY